MATDEAGTRFLDGMRVATEHMRHLQRTTNDAARQWRETVGTGKVGHGFAVEASGAAAVTVSPGFAIDGLGRPVVLDAPMSLAIDAGMNWVAARYELRSSLLVDGVPTLLGNGIAIEARAGAPPWDDGAVPLAELLRGADGLRPLQHGGWFLAPLDHRHSGEFITDAAGRRRFDGHPIGGGSAPQFDSGFVAVAAGSATTLSHRLRSLDLAVELTSRRAGGPITNRGVGADYWFELVDPDHVVLARAVSGDASAVELRVRIWRPGAAAVELARPIADAGDDRVVAPGVSFALDASRSRAAGARQLVRYRWTQLD